MNLRLKLFKFYGNFCYKFKMQMHCNLLRNQYNQLDDHDFLTIWPTSGCHGQKLLTMAKNFKNFRCQNRSFLIMTMARI